MKERNPERCRVTWFNLQHEREEEEEPLLRRIDEIKEMNNSLNREMSFYLILQQESHDRLFQYLKNMLLLPKYPRPSMCVRE